MIPVVGPHAGRPLPGIPAPGDPISIAWADSTGNPNAYLVAITIEGLWWVPDTDGTGALFAPWSQVESIEGPKVASWSK